MLGCPLPVISDIGVRMKTPKQGKTRKHTPPPADVRNVLARYKAYAIARDGSRYRLDARRIVVDIGDGVFEHSAKIENEGRI
jgi:hypothetical protein